MDTRGSELAKGHLHKLPALEVSVAFPQPICPCRNLETHLQLELRTVLPTEQLSKPGKREAVMFGLPLLACEK